jgi:hypothetical protein
MAESTQVSPLPKTPRDAGARSAGVSLRGPRAEGCPHPLVRALYVLGSPGLLATLPRDRATPGGDPGAALDPRWQGGASPMYRAACCVAGDALLSVHPLVCRSNRLSPGNRSLPILSAARDVYLFLRYSSGSCLPGVGPRLVAGGRYLCRRPLAIVSVTIGEE